MLEVSGTFVTGTPSVVPDGSDPFVIGGAAPSTYAVAQSMGAMTLTFNPAFSDGSTVMGTDTITLLAGNGVVWAQPGTSATVVVRDVFTNEDTSHTVVITGNASSGDIPLPASLVLMLTGLAGLGAMRA